MWRHAETGAVVDLASFWVAGQPNGVRVQNCAGIWELVSSAARGGRLPIQRAVARTAQAAAATTTEAATRRPSAPSAASARGPAPRCAASAGTPRPRTCFTL